MLKLNEMVGNNSSVNGDQIVKLSLNPTSMWFLVIFCSIQILIGSIANFVVIVTISVSRQLRQRSEDRLILNLAITDFVCLTTLLPWHIYLLTQLQIDITGTSFIGYITLKVLLIITAANTILSLAVDRFAAVVFPLRHFRIIDTRIMTVFSWGVGVGFAASWQLVLLKYQAVVTVVYGALLLAMSLILYSIIFYHTLKQGRKILNQRRSIHAARENFSSHLLMKITLRTFVVMCLFYVTYLPMVIYASHFSLILGREWAKLWNVRIWIYSFMYSNSCINPFIYGLRTNRFRKEFHKKIWSRGFRRHLMEVRVRPVHPLFPEAFQ